MAVSLKNVIYFQSSPGEAIVRKWLTEMNNRVEPKTNQKGPFSLVFGAQLRFGETQILIKNIIM